MLTLIGILIVLALLAMVAGYLRGMTFVRAYGRNVHSLSAYHGTYLAISLLVPAAAVLVLWSILQPIYVSNEIDALLPPEVTERETSTGLVISQVARISQNLDRFSDQELEDIRSGATNAPAAFLRKGVAVSGVVGAWTVDAALHYRELTAWGDLLRLVAVLAAGMLGFFWGYTRLSPRFHARNRTERAVRVVLISCSGIAILTTLGIISSMLFESIEFFALVPLADFFLGTVWDPRFSSAGRDGSQGQFGLIPLLWGTLYITLIAMLVAVPIGLNAAIYLSEYAGSKFRSLAKPLLEILAGIPTIVYGFFAIILVGPLLNSIGQGIGWNIGTNSVLTAGLVMGMMIIPFVSSLSDDIINAVPQSLRDASYGLGATQAETIRRVVLPAALPGVVGAVLLAVSRAIGETMIVVMAAGVAANISLDPGEAMTTITVKIVSQLTGDTEFTSPQTLVAFALGITLFTVTLVLNVVALQIVRHYREQYE